MLGAALQYCAKHPVRTAITIASEPLKILGDISGQITCASSTTCTFGHVSS